MDELIHQFDKVFEAQQELSDALSAIRPERMHIENRPDGPLDRLIRQYKADFDQLVSRIIESGEDNYIDLAHGNVETLKPFKIRDNRTKIDHGPRTILRHYYDPPGHRVD